MFFQRNFHLFSRSQALIGRLSGKAIADCVDGAAIGHAICALYGQTGAIMRCAFWQSLGVLGDVGELWAIFRLS